MCNYIPKESTYAVLYGAGDHKLSKLTGVPTGIPEIRLFACGFVRYCVRNNYL